MHLASLNNVNEMVSRTLVLDQKHRLHLSALLLVVRLSDLSMEYHSFLAKSYLDLLYVEVWSRWVRQTWVSSMCR